MASSYYNDAKAGQGQDDDPPNSRLFIVGNKKLTEKEFRDAFSPFGDIEGISVVKDRTTGENKGVTYIKFSKTSEAANAMEAMNGRMLPNTDRSIKIMIASSRNKGSQRQENEDEKIQRLFVLIPKTMTEVELESHFKQFGEIEYVNIVKDRDTRESKGFAYIKYYKFSHAAKAFEECDRKYKAVFSEPRKPNIKRQSNNDSRNDYPIDRHHNSMPSNKNAMDGFNNDKYYRLLVIGSPHLTEDQLWKLFNIVPAMEFCQLRVETMKRRSIGTVVYATMQWANYAVEKLHMFEYPIGSRLIVKPDGTIPKLDTPNSGGTSILRNPHRSIDDPNILHLAETIAQATSIIQNAGLGQSTALLRKSPPRNDLSEICSVPLPEPQPLASIDAETEARCFIVCTPPPPSAAILRDVFCRFGNLIEVYLLAHRNCGYAKYSTKQSAVDAIKTLHGADICGGRMKVMEAEERSDHSRKRQRMDDQ